MTTVMGFPCMCKDDITLENVSVDTLTDATLIKQMADRGVTIDSVTLHLEIATEVFKKHNVSMVDKITIETVEDWEGGTPSLLVQLWVATTVKQAVQINCEMIDLLVSREEIPASPVKHLTMGIIGTLLPWNRYRFQANLEDPRPIIWPPAGPYWVSGTGDDHSTVIAYLPFGNKEDDLRKYWPEAAHITVDERDEITFTDRFPQPSWWPIKS